MTGYFPLVKILILLLLFSCFIPTQTLAREEIIEEGEYYYTIDSDGRVSFRYFLKLSAEPDFATAISKYTISLPFENLSFSTIKSSGENLQASREENDGNTSLTINLRNRILNNKNPINLEIIGETGTKVVSQNELTKFLILPGEISNIETKKINIRHPESYGEAQNLGKQWLKEKDTQNIYLQTTEPGKTVTLVWGDTIAYNFEINKKLINSENEPTKTFDLNIPKSHGNQKILFSQISPTPNFAYQDSEDNLFFSYELGPGIELEINITGQIQIKLQDDKERDLNVFEKPLLTETKGYWLLNNEYESNKIRLLLSKKGITANSVMEMSPEERESFYTIIYDYVVDRLNLANIRTTSMESYIRQGATATSTNRDSVSPEDYVDFLTSIYRLYDVPTRMLEGYVIMFDQGFYHSWLEFWDEDNGWRSVDPALEGYSKGDFFAKNFSNHITILSRGYNYIRPRMTFYDNREFKINFAENTTVENLSIKDNMRLNPLKKTHEHIIGLIEVENTGNTIISMKNLSEGDKIIFTNYNALQLIVPEQTVSIPFSYKVSNDRKDNEILLNYTSINGEKLLNPISLNLQESEFWWWYPLVITLKFTVITIIVYVLYLILLKIFKWIERYYQ